jgi:anti-sigma factor RsiW
MECAEAIDVMGEVIDGLLADSRLAAFQEHLGECPACAAYFEQLGHTRAALRSLPPGSTSPHRAELLDRFRRESGRDKAD